MQDLISHQLVKYLEDRPSDPALEDGEFTAQDMASAC